MSGEILSILRHAPAQPQPAVAPPLCTYLRNYSSKLVKERQMATEEANTICLELQRIRSASGRCGHGVSVFVGFWGYGDVQSRNTFLRGIRYALRPRVLFASHKKQPVDQPRSTYFEGVVFFQPRVACMQVLERVFDLFRMGIGSADLDVLMSDAMVTCIDRIANGANIYGNWETTQNQFYRAHFQRIKSQKEEREARDNAFTVTGLHTTSSNLLSLFYGRQNMQIELNAANITTRGALNIAMRDEGLISDALQLSIALEGAETGNAQLLRQSITDILDRNFAMQDALRAIIHTTRTLTVIDLR